MTPDVVTDLVAQHCCQLTFAGQSSDQSGIYIDSSAADRESIYLVRVDNIKFIIEIRSKRVFRNGLPDFVDVIDNPTISDKSVFAQKLLVILSSQFQLILFAQQSFVAILRSAEFVINVRAEGSGQRHKLKRKDNYCNEGNTRVLHKSHSRLNNNFLRNSKIESEPSGREQSAGLLAHLIIDYRILMQTLFRNCQYLNVFALFECVTEVPFKMGNIRHNQSF